MVDPTSEPIDMPEQRVMTIDVDKLQMELDAQELALSEDQWMSVVVSLKRSQVENYKAQLDKAVLEARKDQIMRDFIAYSAESKNDESVDIAIREGLLAELTQLKDGNNE